MSNLEALDISENEESVYRVLLVSGQLSLGELDFATQLSVGDIKLALNSLEEKKLVRKVPGIEGRYAGLVPAGSVRDKLLQSIEKIEGLSRKLEEKSTQVASDLRTDLLSTNQQITHQINTQKQDISQSLNNITDQLSVTKTNTTDEITSKVEQLRSTNQEVVSQFENQSIAEIRKQIEATKNSIQSRITSIEEKTQETKNNEAQIKISASQSIPETDFTPIDNIQTDITGKLSSAKNSFTEQVNNLSNNFNQKIADLQTRFDESKQSLNTLKEQLGEEYSALYSELEQNLDQTQTDAIQSLQESRGSANAINSSISSEFDKIKAKSLSIQNDIKSVNDQFQSTIQQQTDQFRNSMESNINSLDTQISDRLIDTKSTLQVSIQSETDELETKLQQMTSEFLEKTKQQLAAFNQKFSQSIENTVSGLQNDMQVTKQNLEKDALEKSNQIKQSISQQHATIENQFSKVLSDFLSVDTRGPEDTEETTETVSGYVNSVVEELISLVQSVQQFVSEFEQNIENYSSTTKGAVTSTSNRQRELLNTSFTDSLNQIETSLQEKVTLLVNQLKTSEKQLQSKFEETQGGIQQTLSNNVVTLKNGIGTLRQHTLEQLDTALNEMHGQYLEYIDQTKVTSIGSATQLERDAERLETSINEIFTSTKDKLNEEFVGFASLLQNNSEQLFSSITNQLDQIINQIKTTTSGSFDRVASLGNENIEKQTSTIGSTFNEYNQYYSTNTGEVVNNSTALANLLETIFKMQENTDTASIKTTHVIGQVAILERITDIISRVKSKATILVPEVSLVDEESILNLPRTAQITIISYIDESQDQEWIEKLHNATANVTLRSITVSDLGGKLPDFIGIEREGEEILLAAKDEGANDYVGITSLSTDFVQILGNIVIADYARGKSRQIAK